MSRNRVTQAKVVGRLTLLLIGLSVMPLSSACSGTTEEIEYPLTPVESDAAGGGSSTTVLEGVAPGALLSEGPKYLNVHAAGSGDPLQLTCANLGEATQHTS